VFSWQASSFAQQWKELFDLFVKAGVESQTPSYGFVVSSASVATLRWVAAPMGAAWVGATAATLVQGGLVFAPEALGAKFERLNPVTKLKQIFSASGLSSLLKSLLPFGIIGYIGYSVLARDWDILGRTLFLHPTSLGEFVVSRVYELTWKSLLVLLLWSGLDYLLVRLKMERDLRMTRQEVREEAKESDGNPHVKARMRRLQRQVRRRKMLQEVQRATVVVTNPTHFAVALEYRPEMAAPVVLAKGRNLLAQQIKQAAAWHGVPQVENVPLAHALYRSAEVGQSIPAKLYAGVAEVLAFIYRTNQQAVRARGEN
jgi:flagellar biosynthetic protein FlhB